MDAVPAVKQPGHPLPEYGTVDVWRLSLDAIQGLRADALSPEEQQRASRFHFERDRNRFIRCRSWLRSIMGEYLSLPAATVQFEYGERGKPHLAGDQNARNLHFNLAHSGEFALLAVAAAKRVGVDIERIDRLRDHVQIAERYFSNREAEELKSLPEVLQREGFAACWTRKEAFIKAVGTGLSLPLSDFSVTVHPCELPRIIEWRTDLRELNWWLCDLPAPEGYRAALVVEEGPCVLRQCPAGGADSGTVGHSG